MKEIKAQLNNFRISPRKARIVCDIVRGKKVKDAIAQLNFTSKRFATPLMKLLKSASDNAKNNFNVADESNLIVKSIEVNGGPVLKRFMPRARGSSAMIKKRTSRVSLVIIEQTKKTISKVKKTKIKKHE